MNNGTYRCQSCDKDFESCPQRLFQSVLISDDTAEIWATLFHDEAEQVIGENASELFALKESDSEAFEMKIKSLSFRTFICRVRATRESYQDKVTTKVTIAAADEMNPPSPAKIEHGRQMVSLIKQLSETM
jgi:replication factor A1